MPTSRSHQLKLRQAYLFIFSLIMATFSSDRKRRIFEHLKITTEFVSDSKETPSNLNSRKKQIMEHIERTLV